MSLQKAVCVVTGAGRGIGFMIAKTMSERGFNVIGLDINFNKDQSKYNFLTKNIDLSNKDNIASVCHDISKKYKEIKVLVNCAGITKPKEGSYSILDWTDTFKINLEAPFLMIENLKNALIACEGSVINISSLNGKLAFPDNPAYVSSKTGLDGLTRSYALELGKHNVRVNSIAPGYIKTEMTGDSWTNLEKRKARRDRTMLGRWGTPEDITGPVFFLASKDSKYITGQTIYVDGGWSSKGF